MLGEGYVRKEDFGIFSRNLDRRLSAIEISIGSGGGGGGGGGSFAGHFINLSDVPASYSGDGLRYVRVNSGATGLEFGPLITISASAPSGGEIGDIWLQTGEV